MNLSDLGFTSQFAAAFEPFASDRTFPARVVAEAQHVYRLMGEQGEILARVSGRFRHRAAERHEYPVIGDWVVARAHPDHDTLTIEAVLPRASRFSRKVAGNVTDEQVLAANIDTVLLVMGLDNDFSPRRLERYLALAWSSGASPVVLLNKADVAPDVEAQGEEVRRIAAAAPVHVIAARESRGLDALAPYLVPGRTVALLGSSGVGKTTIINRLVGADIRPTREVRESDDRGRHTTTNRELIVLPGGGLIIDTPGLRELQLWDVAEALAGTFDDVEAIARECRFGDCTHRQEPGCAVRARVDRGELSAERLASYHKLVDELTALDARRDQRAAMDAKRKSKIVHKALHKMQRDRGR